MMGLIDDVMAARFLDGQAPPTPREYVAVQADHLAAIQAKLALWEEMRVALETMLDYVPEKCDDNMHPAYCCNHNRKRCHGTAEIAKVRAITNKANALKQKE